MVLGTIPPPKMALAGTLLSSLDQIAELPAIGKPLHFVLTTPLLCAWCH